MGYRGKDEGGDPAAARIDAWGAWLRVNVVTITAIVMILLGTSRLGKGIAGVF